jgi:hypothetical protein
MTQYDILLTQNVAPTGVEFSEKLVNIGKGDLLSGIATTKVPTVLAAGPDGYMLVRDDLEVTGLKWVAIQQGHTQGTDTGTTSTTFAIDSDGYNLPITAESASKLGVKVAGGATYADFQAKDGTFNKVTISGTPSANTDAVTVQHVNNLLASLAGALVFKGNIVTSATGNDITPAAFNALATYSVGWQYRAAEAGTFKGFVCEAGDLLTAIVARSGSGNVNTDWTVSQTNIDGAVTGPASATDGHVVLFNGITGKIVKSSGVALGTMASETATNYVPKSLFDANTVLYATTDNTPAALTVAASTFVGRKATGDISAMSAAEARTILNVADGANNYIHPTTAGNIHIPTGGSTTQILQWSASGTAKWITISTDAVIADNGALTIANNAISLAKMADVATGTVFYRKTAGTGDPEVQTLATLKADLGALGGSEVNWVSAPATMTSAGTAGQIAKDGNYIYVCTATNVWKRSPIATNWVN